MTNSAASLPAWFQKVLTHADATEVWHEVSEYVLNEARQPYDPTRLQNSLHPLDRLLAESAWELWEHFPEAAPRTASRLQEWWQDKHLLCGRAVLVMDALSLRELPLLLALFEQHQIIPRTISVTAAEVPTDTDHFATALKLGGRSDLKKPDALSDFLLSSDDLFTDVLDQPFADCIHLLRSYKNDIVIWHSWLDDQLHNYANNATTFEGVVRSGFTGEGAESFWALVEALRQGRRLVITADHGYANTVRFIDEPYGDARQYLQDMLHGSRMFKDEHKPIRNFVPPVLMTRRNFHVALGPRKWRLQRGRYPELQHGGLSLLEAFVPFIEVEEKR